MAAYKLRMIRPLSKILFRSKKAPIRGVSSRRIWHYNGGNWKPDNGEPDLAFVSLDNGTPVVHAAIWRGSRDAPPDHPNEVARASAHEFCWEEFNASPIQVHLKADNYVGGKAQS